MWEWPSCTHVLWVDHCEDCQQPGYSQYRKPIHKNGTQALAEQWRDSPVFRLGKESPWHLARCSRGLHSGLPLGGVCRVTLGLWINAVNPCVSFPFESQEFSTQMALSLLQSLFRLLSQVCTAEGRPWCRYAHPYTWRMTKSQLLGEYGEGWWQMDLGYAAWDIHIHTCETICDQEQNLRWEGHQLRTGPPHATRFQSRTSRC